MLHRPTTEAALEADVAAGGRSGGRLRRRGNVGTGREPRAGCLHAHPPPSPSRYRRLVHQTSVDQRTTYREAFARRMRDALQRDRRVFLMGEDVGRYGGATP